MQKKIILASGSPRRQQLLKEVRIDFEIKVVEVDEIAITSQLLKRNEIEKSWIPEMLAKEKAIATAQIINDDSIVISADTIVLLNNEIIGKPTDLNDARLMLQKLSASKHTVITGVCIYDCKAQKLLSVFSEKTEVSFKRLTQQQIDYYVENYKPLDKAGSYAIQEWIGLIAIEKINGCFYNVMGLPISKLITELGRLGIIQ
jgi:septum formation protein